MAAMGGPWRERGFDPASPRSPRMQGGRPPQVLVRERDEDGLGRIVLVYILAIAMSLGLMLSLMHQGY